jgi:hypothetical protein
MLVVWMTPMTFILNCDSIVNVPLHGQGGDIRNHEDPSQEGLLRLRRCDDCQPVDCSFLENHYSLAIEIIHPPCTFDKRGIVN